MVSSRSSTFPSLVFVIMWVVAVIVGLLSSCSCSRAFSLTEASFHIGRSGSSSSSSFPKTAPSPSFAPSHSLHLSACSYDHRARKRAFVSALSMLAEDSNNDDDKDTTDVEATKLDSFMANPRDFPVRNGEDDPDKTWKTLGLDRAAIIMPIVLLINVWFFTIPPEFRRARLCSEMDTAAYPGVCMTPKMFASGVADYYKQGGGIQWDFSIAEDNPFVAPKSNE